MRFDEWCDLFDSVELPVDDASLTRALQLRSTFEAKLTVAAGSFDGLQMWDGDGSTSMSAWLRSHGLTTADSVCLASWGKRLRSLPVLRDAWVHGALDLGQVKTIFANVRDKHVDLFASHEAELIPELSQLSGRDTQVAMTQWRMMAEALDDVDPPDLPRHEKHLSQTLDGRWEESGSYGAEGGAVIDAALRLVMDMQAEDEREWAAAQRRGNAMVDVCRFFLDNQSLSNPGRRNRPHLHVAIESISDDRVAGELAEQRLPLDSPTLSRLLCDCDLHRVVRDQAGALLDYGTGSQTIPANLWRAIVARDRHCRYPGCDRPPTWCEGHHVQWFSRRGPTSKDNLVVLCSRHHHKLHVPGWDAKLRPDGELVITMPDGRTQSSRPPAPVGLRDLAKRSTAAA